MQSPTLSFWYWPWSQRQHRITIGRRRRFATPTATMLAQVFKVASNAQTWTYISFDLTPYQGQTIQLYFNVHEDGDSTPTYMYLDDVAIAGAPITHALHHRRRPVAWSTRAILSGTFGGPSIGGGTSRSFPLPQGGCNIPVYRDGVRAERHRRSARHS